MKITLYQNKKNSHKYIEVKRTKCRHYLWRQYIEFDNGIRNNLTAFHRMHKKSIHEVVDTDYTLIER